MTNRSAARETDAPRVEVLALPRTTTMLSALLVVALLTSALFVGELLHNIVFEDQWRAALERCQAQALSSAGTGGPARIDDLLCMEPVERRRVLVGGGVAAFVAALALVVVFVMPSVIERRRRLTATKPRDRVAIERMAALAAHAGLRRPPTLKRGRLDLVEPFCFGRPGAHRIAVPYKLWRDPSFDAAMAHEVSHLVHRDVGFSSLAAAVWFVLGPVLVLPVGVALLAADLTFVPSYAWRAATLGVVVLLLQRMLLRAREHDADLRAVEYTGGPEPVETLVAGGRDPDPSRWRRSWRRHPEVARRLAILRSPELHARTTWSDGLVTSFLATLALPLLERAVRSLALGHAWTALAASATGPLLIGPALGFVLGLALWREALVGRVCGWEPPLVPVVAGVGVGGAAGRTVSLAGSGVGLPRLSDILLTALLLGGATATCAGLGRLHAAATGPDRSRTGYVWTAAGTSSAVFAAGLTMLTIATNTRPRISDGRTVAAIAGHPGTSAVAVGATIAAVVAARALLVAPSTVATPPWLSGRPHHRLRPGPGPGPGLGVSCAVGVTAGFVAVSMVFLLEPAPGVPRGAPPGALVIVSAVAAGMVALLNNVLWGPRGVGPSLVAVPCVAVAAALAAMLLTPEPGEGVVSAAAGVVPIMALGLVAVFAIAVLGSVVPTNSETAPSYQDDPAR